MRNPKPSVDRDPENCFSGDRFLPGVISEESFMRIRVPGRFIAVMAILAASFCLLPTSSKVAVARPIGFVDVGPPQPEPKGDNDGVVLKSLPAGARPTAAGPGSVPTASSVRNNFRGMRLFFAVTKLDYWLFWVR
jgi:hypothetical protein